ncbi:hypothetical protein M9H77_28150 [Catharanthus roseus]|uniref:Uncharacterized protein n=1 Tax=Catharanthus roseus TaxID=4058 RepID=A0ACC0AH72_CATRO|nr:hypothetical protein M9H77_28150 [Catharanthus roseus]
MPCLKDNTITDTPSCDPFPSSIPVELETISEPTLEPPHEPETNFESSAPSSSGPVPETSHPILDGSDEKEEHLRLKPKLLGIINSLEIEFVEYLRIILVLKTLSFSSFSLGSAAAILSLFWCFYVVNQSSLSPCLSVSKGREIAVRKEKRERDRGSRLPVISSRLRPVSEGYTPIIIFLHYRRLDAAAPLLGVRFWFGNP